MVLLDATELQALEPAAHTIFTVVVEAEIADAALLHPATRRAAVLDADDYSAAQVWARDVRAAAQQAIRYPSVPDRPDGMCWAVFAPRRSGRNRCSPATGSCVSRATAFGAAPPRRRSRRTRSPRPNWQADERATSWSVRGTAGHGSLRWLRHMGVLKLPLQAPWCGRWACCDSPGLRRESPRRSLRERLAPAPRFAALPVSCLSLAP